MKVTAMTIAVGELETVTQKSSEDRKRFAAT